MSGSEQSSWPIQPSSRLQAIIALLFILGVGASILNGLSPFLRIGLVLVLAAYGVIQFIQTARPRWKTLVINDDGLILFDRADASTTLVPGARSFVSPVYIGVVGQENKSGKRQSLGLFRDQLDPEAFRRLSVFLRRPRP